MKKLVFVLMIFIVVPSVFGADNRQVQTSHENSPARFLLKGYYDTSPVLASECYSHYSMTSTGDILQTYVHSNRYCSQYNRTILYRCEKSDQCDGPNETALFLNKDGALFFKYKESITRIERLHISQDPIPSEFYYYQFIIVHYYGSYKNDLNKMENSAINEALNLCREYRSHCWKTKSYSNFSSASTPPNANSTIWGEAWVSGK